MAKARSSTNGILSNVGATTVDVENSGGFAGVTFTPAVAAPEPASFPVLATAVLVLGLIGARVRTMPRCWPARWRLGWNT